MPSPGVVTLVRVYLPTLEITDTHRDRYIAPLQRSDPASLGPVPRLDG